MYIVKKKKFSKLVIIFALCEVDISTGIVKLSQPKRLMYVWNVQAGTQISKQNVEYIGVLNLVNALQIVWVSSCAYI